MNTFIRIQILLADDHQLLREGLRSLLAEQPNFDIVGEASNGHEAVELTVRLKPQVVLMDVTMPDLNGMEATRQIHARTTGIYVLGLSMHDDMRYVVAMLQAGAAGYLLKDCATEELVRAIQTVVQGQVYLSSRVSGGIVQDYLDRLSGAEPTPLSHLSEREREVLQLITEGHSTAQIANQLIVSVKTVESHRGRIMEKLDLHSIAELTKFAIRTGLTSLE